MSKLLLIRKLLLTLFFALLCIGCAGPMNPFGSTGVKLLFSKQNFDQIDKQLKRVPASVENIRDQRTPKTKAKISFFPERQLFHNSNNFKFIVEDPLGVTDSYYLAIFLNNQDITSQILSLSKLTLSRDRKSLQLTLSHIRFRPEDENQITVLYSNGLTDLTIYKQYELPSCQFTGFKQIRNSSNFKRKERTLTLIEELSFRQKVNSNFISGLIAQESSFNSKAVSTAKAIGLTQITSMAEKQIVIKSDKWPQNKNIRSSSVRRIKSLINRGKINYQNEWRLDKEKSIIGSIRYLNFIKGYWQHPNRLNEIRAHYAEEDEQFLLSDLILASYNSGAYRVRKSLRRRGRDWLNSTSLKEAKKYVRRVKSYCYTFATEEETENEKETIHF